MRSLAFAAVMLVGCSNPPTSSSDDLVWAVGVTPSAFRVGDTATVQVVVTNRGIRPHDIMTNACPDSWVVTTTNGTVVGPRQLYCAAFLSYKTLAAGETYVFSTRTWTGDALSDLANGPPKMLAPGDYVIRLRLAPERKPSQVRIQITQ